MKRSLSTKKVKTKNSQKNSQQTAKYCPNCGELVQTSDRYCPHCGQKNHDLDTSILHMAGEAVEGFLHFDGKSFQTLRYLASRPGFLTQEFIKGRRMRYVAPIRLYIFISFLFFLLLGLSGIKQEKSEKEDPAEFSITFYGIDSQCLRGLTYEQIDSVMQKHDIKPTMINTYLIRQMARAGSGSKDEFKHFISKAISYMMFALMPVFAFYIFLFYRKNKMRYLNTLIFSVHFHCFMFLFFLLCLFLYRFTDVSAQFLAAPVVFPTYLFLALRRMFGNTRWMTFSKIFFIGLLYAVSMAFLFLLSILMSLLVF